MLHYKYSLDELENMLPWERKIYMSMLENYIKEKNEEIQRQSRGGGRVETPM